MSSNNMSLSTCTNSLSNFERSDASSAQVSPCLTTYCSIFIIIWLGKFTAISAQVRLCLQTSSSSIAAQLNNSVAIKLLCANVIMFFPMFFLHLHEKESRCFLKYMHMPIGIYLLALQTSSSLHPCMLHLFITASQVNLQNRTPALNNFQFKDWLD